MNHRPYLGQQNFWNWWLPYFIWYFFKSVSFQCEPFYIAFPCEPGQKVYHSLIYSNTETACVKKMNKLGKAKWFLIQRLIMMIFSNQKFLFLSLNGSLKFISFPLIPLYYGHQCAMDDWSGSLHLNEPPAHSHYKLIPDPDFFSNCVLKNCTYSAFCFPICLCCLPFLTFSVPFKSLLLILMKCICLVFAFHTPSIMIATEDTRMKHTHFPWHVLSHGKDMQKKKSFQ